MIGDWDRWMGGMGVWTCREGLTPSCYIFSWWTNRPELCNRWEADAALCCVCLFICILEDKVILHGILWVGSFLFLGGSKKEVL